MDPGLSTQIRVQQTANLRLVRRGPGCNLGAQRPAGRHQSSDNNSKPQFIFGHSCQAVGLIVRAAASFLAVPLSRRIHEGVIFTNRDRRSLLDKLVLLVNSLAVTLPFYLVADAPYASAKIIRPLLKTGQHLAASLRTDAVAYEPAPAPSSPRRGRPRTCGPKIHLRNPFKEPEAFVSAPSPVS